MPVYEPGKKGWGWPAYLAIGCGGCAVLVILFLVGSTMAGLYFARKGMNQMKSGTMPGTVKASVPLPNGKGTLEYWWNPLKSSGQATSSGGIQGLRLVSGHGKPQEWMLPLRQHDVSKIDVYWHESKGGQGPLVRLRDSEGETLVDIAERKVGSVERHKGRATMIIDDSSDSFTGMGRAFTPRTQASSSAGKQPTKDVTAIVAATNSKYLGSIAPVAGPSGKALGFIPAPAKKP